MPIQKILVILFYYFYDFLASLFVTPSYYHTFLPHLVITTSARLFTALPIALPMELLKALF